MMISCGECGVGVAVGTEDAVPLCEKCWIKRYERGCLKC